jgi:hypothetical protein
MAFPSPTGPNSYIWNLKQVYVARMGNNWPTLPSYVFFAGGGTGTNTNIIDYVEITSTGNATDFGDLSVPLFGVGGLASTTRGIMAGGSNAASTGVNTIQYITMSSKGNTTNFGNLNAGARVNGPGTLSNSTRGIVAGAEGTAPTYPLSNVIDYITIASVGNATDFGDLSSTRYVIGATASTTRGVFAGGSPQTNVIEYITIASIGNTTDFGDLPQSKYRLSNGVVSSTTRGIFAGGRSDPTGGVNTIDYITIATTGNATDFGDLLGPAANTFGSGSNLIRGVFGGGESANTNVIQYITIATTGNALDFGDLTVGRTYVGGFSNANGGLS